MSSRIKEIFSRVKTENRKALINYIVSGDPNLETTLDIMNAMVEEGVDIIELGVPFRILWQKEFPSRKATKEP